uniref:C-type lysozyme inhibitor domain-containing protein n=1 Tax=Oscillatoriales cyanobacterium SpSt-402 TaxID=2282168 RepID=A0A832H5K5_9CYAN
MKRFAFALLLALTPAVASADPLCYMKEGNGRTTDLTAMCGMSNQEAKKIATSPRKGIDLDSPERRIKVGETRSGLDIVFDRDSVSAKTFALKIVTDSGTRNFEFEYACSEKRVFLENTSVTSNATKKTYKVSDEGGNEMKFDQSSAADLGLQLACRQSKSPGY